MFVLLSIRCFEFCFSLKYARYRTYKENLWILIKFVKTKIPYTVTVLWESLHFLQLKNGATETVCANNSASLCLYVCMAFFNHVVRRLRLFDFSSLLFYFILFYVSVSRPCLCATNGWIASFKADTMTRK